MSVASAPLARYRPRWPSTYKRRSTRAIASGVEVCVKCQGRYRSIGAIRSPNLELAFDGIIITELGSPRSVPVWSV